MPYKRKLFARELLAQDTLFEAIFICSSVESKVRIRLPLTCQIDYCGFRALVIAVCLSEWAVSLLSLISALSSAFLISLLILLVVILSPLLRSDIEVNNGADLSACPLASK